jgi:crossover junction endodeoxyribonuclease RuvC
VIILGTDSGLERTGYSIFKQTDEGFGLSDYGCIFTQKTTELSTRLYEIMEKFTELLEQHSPDVIVMERLFYNLNKKTAINVAQTQGVLLALAEKYHCQVEFLTPPQIKLTITGDGGADKKQVEKMIQIELDMKVMPKPDDVVDAIACGMAYVYLHKI